MSASRLVVATAIAFVLGVCGLCLFGKPFLARMDAADTTVCYLDLARQAGDRRDYKQAEQLYEQAFIFAREHDNNKQMQTAVLEAYLKFAIRRKQDRQLAAAVQTRLDALRL